MTEAWFGTRLRPLAGGYSGETFLVGDEGDDVVLRIYRRDPHRAAIDAALMRLLRGIVPVPRVLEVRRATASTPALLVTERLDGIRLDQVLASPPVELDWRRLGANLGQLLAALSAVPFLHFGLFVDAQLHLTSEGAPGDLADWAGSFRATGRLAAWPERDWAALLTLVETAEQILADDPADRTVLVHSDFNPKNILVDQRTCEITGLVDWEFAHAGGVHADLGNVTRFERDPRLVDPLVETYRHQAPRHAPDPWSTARAADVWALIELAGRVPANAVGELAEQLLLAQARTGDLDAWPWLMRRVDPIGAHDVS